MANLETFLQDLLSTFLPGYETGEGGVLHARIIQPILDRVGEGALTTDVNEFLRARLLEEFPEISAEAGDAVTDILIHAAGLFFESYRRELAEIAAAQSIAGPLSLEDATALAANWYVTPKVGARASTFVRVEFARPTTFETSASVVFLTRAGLRFYPAEATEYTAFSMLDNVLANGNYYVDILVLAEAAGSQYNVAEKEINQVSGIPGAQAIYNVSRVETGVDPDTAESLIRTIPKAINERSIVTAPGLTARVATRLDNVANVQVIGFKDPEMRRDTVRVQAPGETFAYGAFIAFDRHVLVYLMGNSKDLVVGDKIQLKYPEFLYSPDNVFPPETFDILEVLPEPQILPGQKRYLLHIDGSPSPVTTDGVGLPFGLLIGFCDVQKTPTVVTNVDEVTKVYPSGEVHFGGHSDAYIATYLDREATTAVTAFATGFQSEGFTVDADNLAAVEVSGVTIPPHLLLNGNLFRIYDGDLQGFYEIAYATVNLGTISIHLRSELVAGIYADAAWAIVPNVEIDLYTPAEVMLPFGSTVLTVNTAIENKIVECSVDVSNYGVAVGDVLEILDSDVAGKYRISEVLGDKVKVDRALAATYANLAARIISEEQGIFQPLSKVLSVTIDDAKVPYGKPLLTEVQHIGGARELFVDGSGCVFPAVKACLPLDVNGNVADIVVPVNYVSLDGNERSYSADADLPDRVILTLETWEEAVGVTSEFTQEIFIPRFLWEPGRKNNVYVATGNISYADLDTWIETYFGYRGPAGYVPAAQPLPVDWRSIREIIPTNLPDPAPVGKGDVLTVTTGPNKGSYIVESSYLLQFNFGTRAEPKRLPIRLIKIEDEFPSDPFSGLYEVMDTIRASRDGKDTRSFGDALRLFLAPHKMLSQQLLLNAGANVADVILQNLGVAVVNLGELPDVLNVLEDRVLSAYGCGKPATGMARVYFQDPVTFELQTSTHSRRIGPDVVTGVPRAARVRSLANTIEYGIDYSEASIIAQNSADLGDWRRDINLLNTSIAESIIAGDAAIPDVLDAEIRLDGRDMLAICEQIHGTLLPDPGAVVAYKGLGVVSTKNGSNKVTWRPTLAEDFPYALEDIGALFFLESGPDKGSYVITGIDAATKTITLNKSMTYTTPAIRTWGRTAELVTPNTVFTVIAQRVPNNTDVGKYITLYNGRVSHGDIVEFTNRQTNIGTFEILSVTPDGGGVTVEFDGLIDAGYLLDPAVGDTYCSWVITESPNIEILDLENGYRECVGQVDYRVYDSNPTKFYVYDVLTNHSVYPRVFRFWRLSEQSAEGIAPFDGFNFKNPFMLYREGQLLITSQEMAQNKYGSVYYADIPIRSIGFMEAANTAEKICDIGPYRCEGYTMRTESPLSSFSVQERVFLALPPKFTPETADYFESTITTPGKSTSITYRYCPDVATLQAIMDNYSNRVMCASLLARRMLPAEVGLNITYTAGVSETTMKSVVSQFLTNSFAARNVLSVSSLVSTMYSKGATHVVLPLDILYIVEDLNRDRFLRKSQDALRYVDVGYYDGTARITHWNPSDTMIVLSRNPAARNLGV